LNTPQACNGDEVTKRAKRTGIAIRLILLTAVRRSELTAACWSALDLEAKAPVWDIPAERTKTGVAFAVPLTPPAVEQFKRLKRMAVRSPWVFPAEDGDGPMDPKLLTRSVARHLDTFAEHKVGAFKRSPIKGVLNIWFIPTATSQRPSGKNRPATVSGRAETAASQRPLTA